MVDKTKLKKILKYIILIGIICSIILIVFLVIDARSNDGIIRFGNSFAINVGTKDANKSNESLEILGPPDKAIIISVSPLNQNTNPVSQDCIDYSNGYIRLNFGSQGTNQVYKVKVYTNIDGGAVAIDVNGTSNGFQVSNMNVDLNIGRIGLCSDAYWIEVISIKNNESIVSTKAKWTW